jgi:hypothetical protein
MYSILTLIIFFLAIQVKRFLLGFIKNLSADNITYILYLDIFILILLTFLVYYIFEVYKYKTFVLPKSSVIFIIRMSFLINIMYYVCNSLDLSIMYAILTFLCSLFDLCSCESLKHYLFTLSVNPSSSNTGTATGSASASGSGSGSGNASASGSGSASHNTGNTANTNTNTGSDGDVTILTSLEYFNNLIEKRKHYLERYEYFNRKWNNTDSMEYKFRSDKYGEKLDKVEIQIEKLKREEGFADPDDFVRSPDASDSN